MENFFALLIGVVALVFGIHAVMTGRVTFGDDRDEVQVWLYGWRAVVVGFLAIAMAALLFASAAGFVKMAWV